MPIQTLERRMELADLLLGHLRLEKAIKDSKITKVIVH